MKKEETFAEYLGRDAVERLLQLFSQVLEGKGGAIILIDEDMVVHDAYKSICSNCVKKAVKFAVDDAVKLGLLEETDD